MTTLSAVQVDVNTTSDQINAQLVTLTEKYLGNNQFVLSGTNTGYIGAQITAMAPWGNLANRYFPTVATLPNSGGNLVTKSQLGYYTPNNVGVTTYLSNNITSLINIDNVAAGSTYTYSDPTKFNKGRGLTNNDQNDIISHIENLNWLKAMNTGTSFDGQVMGTNNYQKFIPYQSNFETTKIDSNGVVSIKDDFEFWTGDKKDIWLITNKFTEQDWLKYYDLNSRITNLLVSPSTSEMCAWQTDVYGNQYALYKTVPATGRTIYNMQNAYGQLWVKTIDGTISLATSALSAVFAKYTNQPAIYAQLSANNIKNIEIFYDTLILELSGYTLYNKLVFDYSNSSIGNGSVDFLTLDYHARVPTRLLSSLSLYPSLSAVGLTGNLVVGNNADIYYGGHWYNEPSKKFVSCLLLSATYSFDSTSNAYALLSAGDLIVPVLYEYDINKPGTRTRIFPDNNTDYSYFIYAKGASAIDTQLEHLTYVEPPVITYNKDVSSYTICFVGYVQQNFNLVCYNTKQNLTGKILTNEAIIPIVTDNNNTILAV